MNGLESRNEKMGENHLMTHVNRRFSNLKDEVTDELKIDQDDFIKTIENVIKIHKIQSGPTKKREKLFDFRESLVTELLKNRHVQSLRNCFYASFIIFFGVCALSDKVHKGKVQFDFSLILRNFVGLGEAMLFYWTPMMLASLFVVYYGFRLWVYVRQFANSIVTNVLFLSAFLTYLTAFIILPTYDMDRFGCASRIIILLELTRMLMKSYAFLRSNVEKILFAKKKVEDEIAEPLPTFSQYVYFMFAPTLVYSNNYPRTSHVRWRVVLGLCFEILSVLVAYYLVLERISIPYYTNLKYTDFTVTYVFKVVFICSIPGVLMFLLSFYGFIDRWMNLWAELLRFGDRQFYTDWWNTTSYSEFLRNWNRLVQNWIYHYMYRDLSRLTSHRAELTRFLTLEISAIVHDFLLSKAVGSFIPAFLITFTVIYFSKYIPMGNGHMSNTFVLFSIGFMFSSMLSYSSMEYFLRNNLELCPRVLNPTADYWVPRFFQCSVHMPKNILFFSFVINLDHK